jgi:hypothetical protein
VSLCCTLAAGCGGSGHLAGTASTGRTYAASVAERVCGAARGATAELTRGAVKVRVTDGGPGNLECRLDGGTMRLDIVVQASVQAWQEFDTTTVHQEQVYGSGGFHEPREIPKAVSGVGVVAAWIPAQDELVATNGTPTRGGSYLTVTVKGKSTNGPPPLALARVAARATLASRPCGPNPAPSG